ncbi:MAG: Hsp20/alpha crystallin family protein [Pseudochelatococcus sp.]|uniref:Hsp20/alpha crystallin family protein n=1 Tax=Pseudochelatococcus sp. TaxID=2020869 RepID=UPI003D8E01FA
MSETEKNVSAEEAGKGAPALHQADLPSPFEFIRRQIDQVFDDFGFGKFRQSFAGPTAIQTIPAARYFTWALEPAVDLVEKDEAYEIAAELPGLDEKDVEVSLSGGILTIRGEKSAESDEKRKGYHLSERRYGAFTRSFRVPDGIDAEKIEASFAKGVLTVRLPKSATATRESRAIEVKAG